jgi:hypothetical protein
MYDVCKSGLYSKEIMVFVKTIERKIYLSKEKISWETVTLVQRGTLSLNFEIVRYVN